MIFKVDSFNKYIQSEGTKKEAKKKKRRKGDETSKCDNWKGCIGGYSCMRCGKKVVVGNDMGNRLVLNSLQYSWYVRHTKRDANIATHR
jgi:hypothetical protein